MIKAVDIEAIYLRYISNSIDNIRLKINNRGHPLII